MYLLQPATCLDAKTTAALCLCAAHAVIMLTAKLGGAIDDEDEAVGEPAGIVSWGAAATREGPEPGPSEVKPCSRPSPMAPPRTMTGP